MFDSISMNMKETSKANEKLFKNIILIHTINIYFGLKAID
jgi:hypothetical protein